MVEADRRQQVAMVFATVLVVVTSLRLVVATVSGVIAAGDSAGELAGGRAHTGEVLSSFGSAGSTIGALLAVAAVAAAALCWQRSPMLRTAAGVVVALTAASIVVGVTGAWLVLAQIPVGRVSSQLAGATGYGLADLLLCIGGGAAAARLAGLDAAAGAAESEPVLFAVDRVDAEVFAFFSRGEAVRTLSVYSIEDGEFDFYDDDGTVVTATVEAARVRFASTDARRPDELLGHLRRFAAKERLRVGDDDDDPLVYAGAISDWQWLQLWPGWLRPIGRLVRMLTAQRGRSKSIAE